MVRDVREFSLENVTENVEMKAALHTTHNSQVKKNQIKNYVRKYHLRWDNGLWLAEKHSSVIDRLKHDGKI